MTHPAQAQIVLNQTMTIVKVQVRMINILQVLAIITDLAVMDVVPEGLKVIELAPGVTKELLQSKTGCQLIF